MNTIITIVHYEMNFNLIILDISAAGNRVSDNSILFILGLIICEYICMYMYWRSRSFQFHKSWQ